MILVGFGIFPHWCHPLVVVYHCIELFKSVIYLIKDKAMIRKKIIPQIKAYIDNIKTLKKKNLLGQLWNMGVDRLNTAHTILTKM